MCGITGFLAPHDTRSRSEMHVIGKAMTKAIIHRGPDSSDIWQDPETPLLLGHRRLSILDLSQEGAQPMTSETGRYVIAYNGEIYNHFDIRREIGDQQWRGRSDTETLLAAVEKWGLNRTLPKLNGMFAFALWDKKQRQLHLVRDRFGKKPLYVGWAGDTLVFGSELKTFQAHPDFKKTINRSALDGMLRHGFCNAPQSIFEGVWALPPAHRVSFECSALNPRSDLSKAMVAYWDASETADVARAAMPSNASPDDIEEQFDTLLGTCVSDRMLSDVPLGAFLSGGIDSSTIVALMQKHSRNAVKTYTIGFHESGFDEASYAKKVAAHLGTDHHELYLSAKDALDVIPSLPDMYDEPFADISAIPTYLVSRFARESVTVALSGDGGDEMLGGYARHVQGAKLWDAMNKMPPTMRKAIAGGVTAINPRIWDKLNPKHPQFGSRVHKAAGMLNLETRQAVYENLIGAPQNADFLAEHYNGNTLRELQDVSFPEQMMVWDTLFYLPGDILTKLDRASMAVSLEARSPLLDKRIFEFVWRVPHRMKIKDGKGKMLLRNTLKRYVPDHLFERPKQGFTMPVGEWLRGDLKEWAEDLLDEKAMHEDGLLNAAAIRKIWNSHQKGQGNHAQSLWHVLMFQAWHKRWM